MEREELLDRFRRWLSLQYSPYTVRTYAKFAEYYMEYYGGVPGRFSPEDEVETAVEFINLYDDPHTRSVAAYAVKALYRFLGRGDIADRIPKVRAAPKKPEPLTYDFKELRRAILYWPDLRERAILCVSFCLGLRRREVCLLDRSDFNPRTCTVRVHRLKRPGGIPEDKIVPLETWCCEILKEYLRWRRDSNPALFVTEDGERRISYEMVRLIFKRFAEFLKKPGARFHQLRHTRGTELAYHTQDPIAIAELLGHRNPASTMHYIHLATSELAKRLETTTAVAKELLRVIRGVEEEETPLQPKKMLERD